MSSRGESECQAGVSQSVKQGSECQAGVTTTSLACSLTHNVVYIPLRLDMLKAGGRFVEYGIFGSKASVDWSAIAIKGMYD